MEHKWESCIERGAVALVGVGPTTAPQVSIAISQKRIADAMEGFTNALADFRKNHNEMRIIATGIAKELGMIRQGINALGPI